MTAVLIRQEELILKTIVNRNLITEQKTYLCRVVKDTEVEKSLWKTEYFDDNDNIIESIIYNDDAEVIQFEKREYSNGNLLRIKEIDYENQIEVEKTYKYQNDILVQERIHLENGTYYDTNYSYDENEKILSIIRIDESGAVLSKEVYTYEKTSQLVQYFDESEYIFRQEEIEFDKEKRPIKKVAEEFFINEKNEEEGIESIETYEYDAVGNEVKRAMKRYDKIIYWEESSYDSLNNKAEVKIWSIESDFISKYVFKYDHKGNTIAEALFENEKLISKFEYLYNHQNKLVKIDKTNLEVDNYYTVYREIIERKKTPSTNR